MKVPFCEPGFSTLPLGSRISLRLVLVFGVDQVEENQAVRVFLKQPDDVAVRHVKVNRIRAPVKLLGIRQLQQHLDLILRFDQLPLRVIVHPGADAVLGAHVTEMVVELARSPHMFPLEHLV